MPAVRTSRNVRTQGGAGLSGREDGPADSVSSPGMEWGVPGREVCVKVHHRPRRSFLEWPEWTQACTQYCAEPMHFEDIFKVLFFGGNKVFQPASCARQVHPHHNHDYILSTSSYNTYKRNAALSKALSKACDIRHSYFIKIYIE